MLKYTYILFITSILIMANESLDTNIKFSISNYTQHLETKGEKLTDLSAAILNFSVDHKIAEDLQFKLSLFSVQALGNRNNIFDSFYETKSTLLQEAYLSYKYSENSTLILGRKLMDITMLGDYYEGGFWQYEKDDFNVFISVLNKGAVFDPDEVIYYEELNEGNRLSYGLESQKVFNPNLTIGGFFYHINKNNLLAGGALRLFSDSLNFEYYSHNGNANGQVLTVFFEKEVNKKLTARLGYVESSANFDEGLFLNDAWNVFEEDLADLGNSKLTYMTLAYQLCDKVNLEAIYGYAKLENTKKQEINFIIGYEVNDKLTTSLLFAGGGISIDKLSKVAIEMTYSF